jgi:hypothetical protein
VRPIAIAVALDGVDVYAVDIKVNSSNPFSSIQMLGDRSAANATVYGWGSVPAGNFDRCFEVRSNFFQEHEQIMGGYNGISASKAPLF